MGLRRGFPSIRIVALLLLRSMLCVVRIDPVGQAQQLSMAEQKQIIRSFPIPEAISVDSYYWLKIENCSYNSIPGQPMLPVRSFVFKLPEGSSVTSTKVEVSESFLQGSIRVVPTPIPVVAGVEDSVGNFSEDPGIYGSSKVFPDQWYVYHHAHGLDPETMLRVEYVVINFYPLRFIPAENRVLRAETVSVTVDYVEAAPLGPLVQLKNLIITSDALEPYAMQLAAYKNVTGIPSIVVNTTWIYDHYSGVDNQEKIRGCIKDFVATYGIVYVTIFGDADQVPVRLAYVPDGQDTYTATDLYYSDLDGTWDDNHDGLYGDQRYDNVDGIPDVYVGRLPPSLASYAQTTVDKIKGYQQQFNASDSWTKRVVLAAGTGNNGASDTLRNASKVLKEYIAGIVSDNEIVKLYESYGNLSTASLGSELNKGALFLNFAGHGDPGDNIGWLFYWVLAPIWWNGFGIVDVQASTNGLKLPVVTTMSCSTARFDDQDSIGEWFVLQPGGGSIAYFGSTRIAWCFVDGYCPDGLMGEMDRKVYESYSQGNTRLGQMWGVPITEYVQSYLWNYQYASPQDVKTVMEFVLLGDPTLRIYSPDFPETLHVPEDFPTIQSAINAAYDGDIVFVSPGIYFENLVVNRSISLVGEDRSSTCIDGNFVGNVVNITARGATVSCFTIRQSGKTYTDVGSGIYVSRAIADCNVSDNVIINCGYGVRIDSSSNNTINGNSVVFEWYGITLSSSSNNIIVRNNVTNTYYGITLTQSSNNTLRNNQMTCYWQNFGCFNNWNLSSYMNDIDTTNTVDGKPVYFWVNNSDQIVPLDAGYVALVNCTRVTVQDLNLTKNGQGVLLAYTKDSMMMRNNLTDCAEGIDVHFSSNNTLSENTLAEDINGIMLTDSSNNSIYKNNLTANSQSGIYVSASSGNHIYRNNMNNAVQVLTHSSVNVWDNGYPSSGNYWADYVDIDVFSGRYQNETGSDVVYDHPYSIDANNIDHYPLAISWTPNLEWDIALTASKQGYSDTCRLGFRIGSTTSFDKNWDEADPPAPVTGVASYLWCPNNPSSPADLRRLSTSIIPPCDNVAWTYKVRPVGIDGTATINWTGESVAPIPSKYSVMLLDSAGTAVADMRKTTEYSFAAESDVTYTFAVRVFVAQNLSLHLNAGWNMVSFPVMPKNSSFSSIFSDVGYSQVVTWSGTSYVDAKTGNVEAGRGYWVLVLSETILNVTGGAPVDNYECDLPGGWSMVGSIYNKTVDGETIFPDYYQLVTWSGTSYVDAKPVGIEPGKGYWTLVLEPTHIIVD